MPTRNAVTEGLQVPAGLFCVVLAAGLAERFGAVKQLADFRGRPMVTHAVRIAEEVFAQRTVLIAGNEWPAVTATAAPLAGYFVVNEQFRSGLGTSIAAGIGAIANCASGVMLLLADQPLIDAAYLRRMVDTWIQDQDRIVASEFNDVVGPPVIFPARFFDELQALDGDNGARKVIQANVESLTRLQCAAAAVDIDRRQDLDNAI